jgi:hypothetical protein
MQFTELVESLLSTQLAEIGLDPEDFAAIVKRAGTPSPTFQILTTHLLALDDFQTFKRMMNKRNLELELQAIQSLQRGAGAQRPDCPSNCLSNCSRLWYDRHSRRGTIGSWIDCWSGAFRVMRRQGPYVA